MRRLPLIYEDAELPLEQVFGLLLFKKKKITLYFLTLPPSCSMLRN